MITEPRMRSHSKSVLQFSAIYSIAATHNIFLHFGIKREKKKEDKSCKISPGRTKLRKIILLHNSVTVILSFEGDIKGKMLST